MNALEAEVAIAALHSTGDFVVLRRLMLENDPRFSRRTSPLARIGLCLDTETTGLNPAADKVIELGMVAFEYNPDTGEIIRITDRYSPYPAPSSSG